MKKKDTSIRTNTKTAKKNQKRKQPEPVVNDLPEGVYAVNQKKFQILLADPPWSTNQTGTYGAVNHYDLMPLNRIKEMPIADLMEENSAVFLWVPNGLIPEGLEVLKSWGYTYRNPFFWVKPGMQLGMYMRNASETILLGTKGKMPVDFRAQPNWGFMPRQEHSHKPEEMYAIIERLYQNRSYLELFARKRPANKEWFIWGNEAEDGSDIYIPGYPVPKYSGRVLFAKEGDNQVTPDPVAQEGA